MPRFLSQALRSLSVSALAIAALAGCSVGPDYERPALDLGAFFEQDQANPGWVPAAPSYAGSQQPWWLIFADPALDALMVDLNAQNLSIEQAQAQYEQALSTVRQTNAALYPTVGLTGDVTRADTAIVLPGTPVVAAGTGPFTEFAGNLGLSWEVDLWGAVARRSESAQATAQASAADLAGARLSAQTALASTYFQVRVLDVQIELLDRTIDAHERSLKLTQNLAQAGLNDPGDVAVAKTQLESSRAQRYDVQWRRTQLENAVAVLLGQTPASFSLPPRPSFAIEPPLIPVGVPSTLLQRRPDIAAAERRTAAANAQIGVATAAWFPELTISATGGYRSRQFAQWFSAPAQFWALGPALALAIFDGGRRQAQIEQAEAGFRAQAANYRLTALRALQEVEDALVQLHFLAQVQQAQAQAVAAGRESLRIRRNQYEQGLVDYLSVAVIETNLYNNQRNAINVMGDRLGASVRLVAALGGGWSVDELADAGNPVSPP